MRYIYFFIVLFLLISCQEKKTKTGSVKQASNSVEYEVSAGVLEPKRNRIKIQNVKKGERLVQRFILSNTGTEMVRILGNDASCNCTEVLISKKEIQPTDTISVQMIVETSDKEVGNHNVNTVLTTNGKQKFYNLEIDFTVVTND
ncbi:DUF1573 domain-containing protein [Capnocytophaga canis]|uniref:DUF1573 domain-containing protein n=1 Tax=Capnocytophaga canis TaxID=1848903 RepID=UPI00370D48C4